MKLSHFTNRIPYKVLPSLLWFTLSCQVSRTSPSEIATREAAQDPTVFRPPLAPPAPPFDNGGKTILLFSGTGTTSTKVGLLAASQSQCQDPGLRSPEVRLRIFLRSAAGWHTLDFTLEGAEALNLGDPVRPDLVHVDVEGHQLSFTSKASLALALRNQACVSANTPTQGSSMTVDQNLIAHIRDWIKAVSPDCMRIDMLPFGFECTLKPMEPPQAMMNLTQTQKTMIQKWSRQPYLFARRVAIGINLAQAISEQSSDEKLNTFCRIISSAPAGELPITLSSQRWQQGVCSQESKNRRTLALYGLSRTVQELEFLAKLFDATSRLGVLEIKIPGTELPEKQILLNLTPEIDVVDKIAEEASKIIAEGQNIEDRENRQICWHPIYGESVTMLKTALGLGLIEGEGRSLCKSSTIQYLEEQSTLSTADRYIAESITSESEFIVTNGQAKTLRLPTGRYSYSLRALPPNHEGWDDASQQNAASGGLILWEQRRPRAIINKW
jgi:hypothetical protein